uniref:Glycosyltransferase n=1 Tax=Florenciella sp. virus SA2 TaxID=3240092 RepID=A0AB39JBT8_9VIRU
MTNVISFSLYGCKATYILGMKENILLGKKFFPEWEIRIHYNDTVPEKYIKEYNEMGASCILCKNVGLNKMNWEGMFWRWLPLDDQNVECWISRDADSRLSEREANIVKEWAQSGKTLHCIRDHRCHYNPIMGGLFGINNKSFHSKYKFEKVNNIISNTYKYYKERPYNVDQIYLNDKLWNLLKDDVMAHISNSGRRLFDSDIEIPSVPLFIGKQYRLNDDLVLEKANIQSVKIEKKSIFKIKSKYAERYFDAIDNKIKLNTIQQTKSQLWTLDENNRFINLSNNKFLDFDKKRDLILSDNNKNTWKFISGGFILNNQTNMAIDFKGGINDKRKEPWLFKLNHSEAQQWDFVGECNKLLKNVINKNEINYDNIFPITTSIPSEVFVKNIDDVIKNKKVEMYDGIKDRTIGGVKWCKVKKRYICSYEFNKENDYYNAYKEAKWGFTKKKNGWDCLRHYEIIANGCLPLFENLENCPESIMSNFPKKLLIEAKNKKDTLTDNEYNYYLKNIFNYFKDNFTCEKVAENFLNQIHKDKNKNILDIKILMFHGNDCNNYMADLLFIGLRRLLKENIVDERKLVQLYKSFSGNAYGKGFTYTKRLSNELVIDRNNIKDKIKNRFFDYIIYRKCGGDEGELGDCRKKMEYWDIVEENYTSNKIVFLYGGDRMANMNINNHISEHLKYHSHKGLCFVREFTTTEIYRYKNFIKTVLILNHNFHHKNKKGLEMICEYLNYNLIYGTEKDIPDADVIYCPSHPFNANKYPDKRFVFGPHLSIFPDHKLHNIQNKNNSVYLQPSPWARDVWTNWKSIDTESLIPVKSFPFPVEIDLFEPNQEQLKENVFVMFKHRKPEELRFVENYLNNNKVLYKTFRYRGYKQEDYIEYLKTCKYGIWIGRHESQGFALEESLSCNVPLLVWNVTNMRQQHGWNGCPDVYGITIPYWSKTCGEYFYKEDEFEKTYNKFLKNLDSYNPREFILNNLSVKQCAENFDKIFLNKKTNNKEYKLLTCANKDYFNALKQFINNVKSEIVDFDNFIVYDIGLTSDQENELYILQAEYGFYIYKLDFSKYPEHANLNLEKWSGLNNSYAFKPIIIYNVLQKINVPLIYMDCGCGFTMETIDKTLINISKNNFYISISNQKNTIESLELNHPDTLNHFGIKNTDIIACSAGFLGINYENDKSKDVIDKWYKYSLDSNILVPDGSNRNNHRQDQTVLSCLLYNINYDYNSNIKVPFSPWKYKGTSTYYKKYKPFSCLKKETNKCESRIYTNSLEEAIECYKNRKNISKEQLLNEFIVQ